MEPAKANPENRTSALRIRLKPREREVIVAAATQLGVGVCTYARMATLRAAGLADTLQKRRKPSEAQRLVAESLGQLARIGVNINQAVHALNAGWDCDPEILRIAMLELRALREAILAATADDRPSPE
ncbi:plasmid mobilization protein [Tardiphaga robiniae]|uniref:MobC family plasmid mobilization relaxosome protein n=1 Tax=Tardiphaga robiniae TaxID=943830 RepID=A0A7G6TYZ2_9BRAD|nr:plasmid mobilization relaxosome protein MobC [Tardiphaga robiniae]QND71974.1 MobC family plasmid mobilization relaxosome protein [Tardiphaga robiniae]